jgi:hypothetical protein
MKSAIQQKIVEIFGLKAFRAGGHSDPNGEGHDLQVRLLWAAILTQFSSPILVSVMHTFTGTKGLILLLPRNYMLQPQPQNYQINKAVELVNWVDPVEQSLKSVDFTELGGPMYAEDAYDLDLFVETFMSSMKLSVNSAPTGQHTLDTIGKAVFTCITEITTRYQPSEQELIRRF